MPKILIVDDEESIRDLIKEVLTADGYEFFLAADGNQAFDVIKKKTVDLAIVDRNMPGMSGIEVVQLIRRNPKTAGMRILMCTGASVTKEIDEAYAAGADGYVLKPFNFAQLIAKVAKTLASPPRST
jgi:DNA-binding response OmpR family regulator